MEPGQLSAGLRATQGSLPGSGFDSARLETAYVSGYDARSSVMRLPRRRVQSVIRPLLRIVLLGTILAVAGSPAPSASAQAVGLVGRVVDLDTGEPVSDATVMIRRSGLRGSMASALSGPDGRFRLDVPGDAAGLRIRVEHLAYGRFDQPFVRPGPGRELLVEISRTAIQLAPIEVSVEGRDARQRRISGTRSNIITREQIESRLGTSANLALVLERFATGVRVRGQQTAPGQPICVEFRSSRTLDNPNACHPPVIVMDGVRVSSPGFFFNWLNLEDVERMEVIPPGEAGVQYGTDSNFGVLVIETRAGMSGREEEEERFVREPRYDFAVEGVPYDWKKTYLGAFVGNAVGLGVGLLVARSCLSFDGLSQHFLESECGGATTLGARIALVTLPVTGAGLGAGRFGRSARSEGNFLQTAFGAALIGLPGYLMATAGPEDAWAGADWAGGAVIVFGVPAIATIADRLWRSERIAAPDPN